MNLQLQIVMFYPNAYLNFDAYGNFTKHYYNGTERICSRLGNTHHEAIFIEVENNNEFIYHNDAIKDRYRKDILELLELREDNYGEYYTDYENITPPTPLMNIPELRNEANNGDIYYYHTNHLGSTAFVTEQNQNIIQGFVYAPFGEIVEEYNANFGNDVIPKYSFNAKELDEETGMYYFEARYYRAPTFISRDPLMNEKPWLTPYHYCSNNPVGKVDPTGMMDEEPPPTKIPYRIENSEQKNPFSQSTNNNTNTNTSTTATTKTPQGGSTPATPQQGTPQPTPNQPSNGSSGWGFSLDVNIAVGAIGYSFEVGFVQDASGNAGVFYSHGTSAGFEASIGLNGFWIPNSNFKLNDFEGQSMSVNVSTPYVISGSVITDYSRGAEKDYYFNNYGGIKVGGGAGVGASVSHTKTYLIKSNPNVGRLEKIYDSNYFRTGGMK